MNIEKNVQIAFTLQHNQLLHQRSKTIKLFFRIRVKKKVKKKKKTFFVKGLLVQREKGFNKL